MLEPLISGVVDTAANTIVTKVVESAMVVGGKVLRRFRHQPEIARQAAQENQENFLDELAAEVERVAILTDRVTDVAERMETSLCDPDSWVLMQEALYSSARTSARGKHRVLARLVAARLNVSADELLAQTAAFAVTATGRLTPMQMRFLGLSTLVTVIRPPMYPPPEPRQEFLTWYVRWLNRQASVYLPFETPAPGDYEHLRLVGCAYLAEKLEQIPLAGFRGLRPSIAAHLPPPREVLDVSWLEGNREFRTQFDGSPLGEHLSHLSQNGLVGIMPTAVGELIGKHVHEELFARQPVAAE